jgi:quercetin dioxygenase-like cupin family protein
MIETKYAFTLTDSKHIERILEDDNVGINHMVLPKGEALPEHYSNSNVYMIVVRGQITLQLNEEKPNSHPAGSILNIPFKTKMNVYNDQDEITEIFVVKAPSPRMMSGR